MSTTDAAGSTGLDVDVVVVGAGMSGLYALKVLREQGLRVVVLEKAPASAAPGSGTAIPGARCDIPSLEYSFGFDPELEQEWVWTEHFASQPEIERYLNHIADRYDLRRDIRLETGVDRGDVRRDDRHLGRRHRGRRTAARPLLRHGHRRPVGAEPPELARASTPSRARSCRRACGPSEGVELEGKRVGIIGTGSSGVQAIPELAKVGGPPHRVPAHRRVHVAVAEQAAHRRRAGRDQGPLPRAAREQQSRRSAARRARPAR